MFKRLLSAALVFCVSASVFAQSNAPIALVSQTSTEAVVKVHPSAPVFKAVQTPNGTEYIVEITNGTPILKKGYPDLEKLSTSLVCPEGMKWIVSDVTPGTYTDYIKHVAPSKGNVYRDVPLNQVAYEYAPVYSQNEFFPTEFAFTREPYVLRDFAGQALVLQPTQYNASTNTVRHYNELTVTLKAVPDASGVTSLTAQRNSAHIVNEFDKVYKSRFLNYNIASQARYTPLDEEGDMLIICYDSFMPAMESFVAWKKQKGMQTELVAKSTIGTTAASIKTYIQNYYNDPDHNLAYVILVGDASQIPSSSTSAGDSDNNYGFITGSDSYPEVFIGRFSATTLAQVESQVEKSIEYEKNPSTGSSAQWYKSGIGIASNEGPGDDNELDYEHMQNIREELMDYNYTDVAELYQGSQGGLDAAGDPSSQDLVDEINEGASVINYTGHGNVDIIATTGFDNSDVPSLTNVGKWPFVWIVGCQTGNFVSNTCIGEAMARATTSSGPTGSVVSFMATINQSWNPPMEAQDEFTKILAENATGNIKRSFGGISMNGCMQMNDAYGGQGDDMTDTWICFGDPSLMIRTDVPVDMTVTHPTTEPVGVASFVINCNTNGALACLTLNGEIISTTTIAGGVGTFNFDPILIPDTLLVTVTAYNRVPYFGNVLVVPANGPFVVTDSYTISDSTGNNNNLADYTEALDVTLSLKNIGNQMATNVTATLTTSDTYVTITDATETFGDIDTSAVVSLNAFGLQVANIIPDGHVASFDLMITDGNGNTWTNPISITLHSPSLTVTTYTVSDVTGNNNGRLDPGENVTITLTTNNVGSSAAITGEGIFTTTSIQSTIADSVQSGNPIAIAANGTQSFTVQVSPTATLYSFVPFQYSYDAGGYTATKSFQLKVGQASEDFETNNFTQHNWQLQGNVNWFTTTTSPFEGTYCSQSGTIGNSQSSVLIIQINSAIADSIKFARRVSSEESWDFLKFFINGVEKDSWSGVVGWSKVAYAVGAGSNTFRWTYIKDNYASDNADAAWLDEIDLPLNAIATAIFNNDETTNDDATVYPNPASTNATVWYAIGQASDVSVDVYNLLGQHVTALQSNEHRQAGTYELRLNTTDMPSGQYVIMFRVDGNTYSRKLDVIK